MVGMAALVVRCGCDPKIITESFGKATISVPKAPALGLLLERPVFRTYNEQTAVKYGRESIDFGKFEGEIDAFKEKEIYERIFREEESGNKYVFFFFAFIFFIFLKKHQKPKNGDFPRNILVRFAALTLIFSFFSFLFHSRRFLNFFAQIDNFREPHFLYLTSGGVDAARVSSSSIRSVDVDNLLSSKAAGLESDDDGDEDVENGDDDDNDVADEEIGG